MSDAGHHVGIVGGGMLGMTLALRLRQEGQRVTLIEGAAAPGGLAAPQEIGGYTWDRFYHVILPADASLQALLEEIGLGSRLRWGTTRTGFFTDGTLYSLSSTLEFLRFPPLSLVDKLRLAGTILYASRIRDWRRLEAIPVEQWLERLSGRRTTRRIWLPLLRSKLGENYRRTSAAFIWAVIARLYGARRSGQKRELFGYVDGGYDTILARLRSHLEAMDVTIACGQPVTQVLDEPGGATVRLADGAQRSFDAVVMTVPSGRIPGLCPQLADGERRRLESVVYQGIICASLLTREPLAGFYVTNITERWVPFTGVIEMTSLVGRERFGGNSLVYLPRYLTQDDPYWARSDAEVEREFLDALEAMYPGFRREQVLAFRISRARDVQAISTLHYSDVALPPVRTSLPHVFVVNSAQIVNGTLNVNETVGVANEKAAELMHHLRRGGAPRAVPVAR